MSNKLTILIVFLLACVQIFGQEKTLSLEQILDLTRAYHPIAKQAKIAINIADANVQSARGLFDPAFYVKNEQKTFDGKNYYSYANPELKIPTWYGLDIKAGFENNLGERLEPITTFGKSSYLGLSVPLLKGALLDKRRSTVLQAKLLSRMSVQDQLLTYNNLLYEAAESYWAWVSSFQKMEILDRTLKINQDRFELVKNAFVQGERAAIDTTEALSQLQFIEAAQSQAWLDFQKQRLELSNFLWKEDQSAYELDESVIPDSSWNKVEINQYPLPSLDIMLTKAMNEHPKLNVINIKQDALVLEKKLKMQSLLPTFDVSYNFLSKGYTTNGMFKQPLFQNNYKYGFQIGMPFFLREARGEYTKSVLKIKDNAFELQQTKLQVSNKVRSYFAEIHSLKNQSLLFQQNVVNQKALLQAEQTKFEMGESSLFLVNSRENKLLETEQKLVELKTKFFKSLISLQWAAGSLK